MEQEQVIDTSMIINLEYPITIGNQSPTKIVTLQRIKGKHLKGLNVEQLPYADQITLAERVTGLTTTTFDEMDAYDLTRVLTRLGELLTTSQSATGK